jgi:hypothetical protein
VVWSDLLGGICVVRVAESSHAVKLRYHGIRVYTLTLFRLQATIPPDFGLPYTNEGSNDMGVEVYVGHISGRVTEDEVRKLFSVAGTVTSVHLVTDPVSGDFRGCGYVRMLTADEAREAVDLLDGAMLGGRLIVVKEAPKKNARQPGSYGGGRGGNDGRPGRGPTKTSR